MKKYVINDSLLEKEELLDKVGGKALSLFKISKLDINVPDFFVISTDAFKDFLEFNDLYITIKQLIKDKEFRKIRELIISCRMPENIWNEIVHTYQNSGMQLVSVRSSAVSEDGAEKSFAGQFDSYLSIPFSKLKDSIIKCWASYYNDSAIEYMDSELISPYSMAVVIQKMIDADISGIGFSKAPKAEHEGYMLIEAAYGVGENIVSGIITPNQYYVSSSDFHVHASSCKKILKKEELFRLGEIIKKISDSYGVEIDTEWCIKNGEIFFLQARPITVAEKAKPYQKTLTRPIPLMRVELLARGEYEGIRWLTDNQYYFNPLFVYRDGEVSVYYNNISQKENPINMYKYLCENQAVFLEKYETVKYICSKLKNNIKKGDADSLEDIIEDTIKVYPFSSLGNLAGNLPRVLVGKVFDIFAEFRTEYGDVLAEIEEYLLDVARKVIDSKDVDFYRTNEILNKEKIEESEIQNRSRGYLFFNNELVIETEENRINKYLNENNIALIIDDDGDDESLIKGESAFRGIIRGQVTKIMGEKDFNKMKQGNVLVTSMTVPKYLPVMKKAGAMVTDEGGVLCHAAIIAREMKIPTVIGTKNATKLLQDGDYVEVDANNGKVTRINRI